MQNVVAKLGKVLFHPITSYMTFHGKATVWEDLNFDPGAHGGPAVSEPDFVVIGNVGYHEFKSSNNQFAFEQREIPHACKLGSLAYAHAHIFLKSGETAGTTGVTFTMYWELRENGATTNGTLTMSATSAELAADGHKVDIFNVTPIAIPSSLGAQLAVKMARTAGNAGDVILLPYGIHYESDSVGSSQMLNKYSA